MYRWSAYTQCCLDSRQASATHAATHAATHDATHAATHTTTRIATQRQRTTTQYNTLETVATEVSMDCIYAVLS